MVSETVVTSPDQLEEEESRALRRHLLSLADSKRLMGVRYSDWALGGPSIESSIATSSMAQDEWGHARLLYAMLKAFGDDPKEIEHERPGESYCSVPPLDAPFTNWAEMVAAMLVVDNALSAALEGLASGRYEAARSRIPKMVAEEVYHRDLARAWFTKIAGGTDQGRDLLADAVHAMVPSTLAWLAPPDDAFRRLVDRGLTSDGQTIVGRFWERCGGVIELVGIEVGGFEVERAGWDEVRGRGAGHPGEEAVERARGDRNRSLLVE